MSSMFAIFGNGDRMFRRIQCRTTILILATMALSPQSSFARPVSWSDPPPHSRTDTRRLPQKLRSTETWSVRRVAYVLIVPSMNHSVLREATFIPYFQLVTDPGL